METLETKQQYDAQDLVDLIRLLRDPEKGCPWDKVQTHKSIRKNMLEEAYEAAEAIDADDPEMLREELGDLLMQVVFHCQMEAERGHFDFQDACGTVCKKLIFRHPHIFGPQAGHTTPKDWETIKQEEKGRLTLAQELDSVPLPLPALMKAQKTLARAGRYGVTVPPMDCQLNGEDASRQVGALLLSVVSLAQSLGVDSEEALTQAVKEFTQQAKEAAGGEKSQNHCVE